VILSTPPCLFSAQMCALIACASLRQTARPNAWPGTREFVLDEPEELLRIAGAVATTKLRT
jgi:hypothetical protein